MTFDDLCTSPTAYSTGGDYSRFATVMNDVASSYFTPADLDDLLDYLLINPIDNPGDL